MDRKEELLSFWVGRDSQELAHHFYALQAQQFYDEEDDPTNQGALWTFKDKAKQDKIPRMLIFDTNSDHLNRIREVNHGKLIKQMQKHANNQLSFMVQYMPQQIKQQKEKVDPNDWKYQNWKATQANYVLIDRKYQEERPGFDLWEGLFNSSQDIYEDSVRKQLEKTDFLRVFTVCADSEKLGFTHRLLQYLKDQCSKKPIIFMNISDPLSPAYFNQSFLPLLGSTVSNIDLLVDFDRSQQQYQYFSQSNWFTNTAPIINSLLTPFILKETNSTEYLQRIDVTNRPLFNIAHTMPIISPQLEVQESTNIFNYLPRQPQNKTKQQKIEDEEKQEPPINRINFVNGSFLNIVNPPKPQKQYNLLKDQEPITAFTNALLTESYILKGEINKLQKKFTVNTSKMSLMNLQGILTANKRQHLSYNQFYHASYGTEVEAYPFHTVMFQHKAFGPSLRNYVRRNGNFKGYGHQMVDDWKQNLLAFSDLYGEHLTESD